MAQFCIQSVMGPTGSGKSTVWSWLSSDFPPAYHSMSMQFIAAASGQGHAAIRHGLRTATSDIRIIKTTHPKNGSSVVFVDTPGFDDTHMTDIEVLIAIADWLSTT